MTTFARQGCSEAIKSSRSDMLDLISKDERLKNQIFHDGYDFINEVGISPYSILPNFVFCLYSEYEKSSYSYLQGYMSGAYYAQDYAFELRQIPSIILVIFDEFSKNFNKKPYFVQHKKLTNYCWKLNVGIKPTLHNLDLNDVYDRIFVDFDLSLFLRFLSRPKPKSKPI